MGKAGRNMVNPKAMTPDEARALPALLGCEQAARVLSVSTRQAAQLAQEGAIKAVKVGYVWRINRDALLSYAGIGGAND